MKKILLISILLVVLLTGCQKNNYVPKESKTLVFQDEGFGTTTLKYYSNMGFDVQNTHSGRYEYAKITSKSDNFVLEMYHSLNYSDSFEQIKESYQGSIYNEYTWNDYNGFTYGEDIDDEDMYFMILLKEEKNNIKVLYGHLEYLKKPKEINLKKLFETYNIQKLLKTITFEEETSE